MICKWRLSIDRSSSHDLHMSKFSCEYCGGVICYCMSSLSFFSCSCWRRASSSQWWVSSVSFWSISLSLSASSLKSRRSSTVFLRESSHSSSRCAWSAFAFSFISHYVVVTLIIVIIIIIVIILIVIIIIVIILIINIIIFIFCVIIIIKFFIFYCYYHNIML